MSAGSAYNLIKTTTSSTLGRKNERKEKFDPDSPTWGCQSFVTLI